MCVLYIQIQSQLSIYEQLSYTKTHTHKLIGLLIHNESDFSTTVLGTLFHSRESRVTEIE